MRAVPRVLPVRAVKDTARDSRAHAHEPRGPPDITSATEQRLSDAQSSSGELIARTAGVRRDEAATPASAKVGTGGGNGAERHRGRDHFGNGGDGLEVRALTVAGAGRRRHRGAGHDATRIHRHGVGRYGDPAHLATAAGTGRHRTGRCLSSHRYEYRAGNQQRHRRTNHYADPEPQASSRGSRVLAMSAIPVPTIPPGVCFCTSGRFSPSTGEGLLSRPRSCTSPRTAPW